MKSNWRTRLIHSQVKVPGGFRSLVTPVFRGSTTLFSRAASIIDTWNHDDVPYTYGSHGTPTTLELAARLAELEHGHRCFLTVLVALDNTWAAGVLFDAFAHGVDISAQALTKYVGGHSDFLLGSVTDRDKKLYERLGNSLQDLGMAVSPDDCWLALRGLQTLHVRLKAIEESALRVASWLSERPSVEAVLHSALPTCPGHQIWKRDFTGSSGLFSVAFRPPLSGEELHGSMDRLKLFKIGYSWGSVSSLVVTVDPKEAPNARVYGGRLLRFYVALEDPVDLIADIEQAFRI